MTLKGVLRRIDDDVQIEVVIAWQSPAHDEATIVGGGIGIAEAIDKGVDNLFAESWQATFSARRGRYAMSWISGLNRNMFGAVAAPYLRLCLLTRC